MPLTHFKLADGGLVSVEDALEKGVLIEQYPTAYLRLVADQRTWKGKVSTTQAIAGTRKEYLKLTTDYAENPDDQAFRTHGSITHSKLEQFTIPDDIVEEKFSGFDMTGVVDSIEYVGGKYYLTDYKTWGSFRVKMALGYVQKTRPMVDADGYPALYQKAGSNKGGSFKKGDQKMEKYSEVDPSQRDSREIDDQLNFYRIIVEPVLDIQIEATRAFVIVRDGGLKATINNGIDRKTYMIPVPRLDDDEVLSRFEGKRDALVSHMKGFDISNDTGSTVKAAALDNVPPPCTPAECYHGRMCRDFCPVADACRTAGGNQYFAEKPEGKGGDGEFKNF